MGRVPIKNHESIITPKKIELPDNWFKSLKLKKGMLFTKDQTKLIEDILYRTVEDQAFENNKTDFDDVEFRLDNILKGISIIFQAYSPLQGHDSRNTVHHIIRKYLIDELKEAPNFQFNPRLEHIMNGIEDLQIAIKAIKERLEEEYPKRSPHRPRNVIRDHFIWQLAKVFKQAGGNIALGKDQNADGPFWRYLTYLNNLLPKHCTYEEKTLRNAVHGMLKKMKKDKTG